MSTALRGEGGDLQLVKPLHPEAFKCVVISTRWNESVVGALERGVMYAFDESGVPAENIVNLKVPGAVELTCAAAWAIKEYKPDAVIVLGCVIRGDTPHFDYVCESVTQGVTMLNAKGEVPVIFGVLTVNTLQQALERAGGKYGNKGVEAAVAAVEMANMMAR